MVSRPDLENVFKQYGSVTDIHIPRDYYTQCDCGERVMDSEQRGFAFIEYDSREAAEDAISHVDNTQIAGYTVSVHFARTNRKTPDEMRKQYKELEKAMLLIARNHSRSPSRRHHSHHRHHSHDRSDRHRSSRRSSHRDRREESHRRESSRRDRSASRRDRTSRRDRSASRHDALPSHHDASLSRHDRSESGKRASSRRSLSPQRDSPRRSESADRKDSQ